MTPIQTANRSIRVQGKVLYNDRRHRIDLKRPIRDLFPAGAIGYVMELCLSKEGALLRMEQLAATKVMPVLLYFHEGETDDDLS